jgi:putative cell wall-binding protein
VSLHDDWRTHAKKKRAVYPKALAIGLVLAFGTVAINMSIAKTAQAAGSVIITESNGSTNLNEMGPVTDTYDVVLTSQPADNVSIGIFPNSQQTTDKSTLLFTSSDWNVPQTVTVVPVQDSPECPHEGLIQHTSGSSDANYDKLTIASVVTHIADGCIRISGNDPSGQSVTVSQYRFPSNASAPAAIIARDGVMADAFTGVPFASLVQAPVLLTPSDSLDAGVATELHRVLTDRDNPIYILGREQAITPIVYDQLRAQGFSNLIQIGGTDRRETAAKIARHIIAGQGAITRAVITEDKVLVDALGAGAGAGFLGNDLLIDPILLNQRGKSSIDPHTDEVLRSNPSIVELELIGGTDALPSSLEQNLYKRYSNISAIHRSGGEDRFDTSKIVAERFFSGPVGIAVANGESMLTTSEPPFGALLASTVGAHKGFPMLIVRTNSVPAPIITYLIDQASTINQLIIVGDTSQVSQAAEDLIKSFI